MKIAIIGTGITKFGEHWDKNLSDLAFEAGIKAMYDAGTSSKDIGSIYLGNMSAGRFTGQDHLGAFIADKIGVTIPSTRVEGACASGALALRCGINSILAGESDVVLVGGAEKMTDVSTSNVTTGLIGAGDEEWEGEVGATFPSLYALMIQRYIHEYNVKKEYISYSAVKNHYHASMNSYAQYPKEITLDMVMNSTMVSNPLTLFDCSPITDGAAAVIIANEKEAKKYTDSPVWITASTQAQDTLALHNRASLTTLNATVTAGKKALEQSNKTIKDIDLCEVHDCFTIAEIMAIEDLGFYEKGKGAIATYNKETTLNQGDVTINSSGGLKACGHPVGATGIKQIVEITEQLKGTCGKRQVNDAEIGMTHNVGGSGATAVVHVLEK
ncbi:MAG: thiolase domain-containing protein [Candidatus Aenigmarchaeota archaeon]|nr:thiolase domain-containing protein [Candidatus Aenigmarchaeota archaeon]